MERKDFFKKRSCRIRHGKHCAFGLFKERCYISNNDRHYRNHSTSGSCAVSPTETEGPFPTKSPSSFVRSDIRDDRTGVAFTLKFTILNTNNSCSALANAIVDIWHCDKDGYYSEYGGSGMQSVDYTSVNFLRGRQTTASNGLVTFTSIFLAGILVVRRIYMSMCIIPAALPCLLLRLRFHRM